ncbi:MAG: hypothetical protein Q9195_005533 [Heterodermia aff. obscurata]
MAGHAKDTPMPALETIERIASSFSLVGTLIIFVTFASSSDFRKPINRLIFYASWGNTLCSIASMISQSGIRDGQASPLCQFQAFLIQMFVPADAFWNLAMAINVYLTLFKKYNAQQLKAVEWKYHLACYGVPFVMALSLLFVETHAKGKVYGPAVSIKAHPPPPQLWCWISPPWDYLRLALCYAPAWIAILAALTIYVIAGHSLLQKRQQLRAFNTPSNLNPFDSFKMTDVQVVSEALAVPSDPQRETRSSQRSTTTTYEPYSVNIMSSPMTPRPSAPLVSMQGRKNRAAMEANSAVWGYTKVALLFFVSLLVTWVPSSINRVYALVHPNHVPKSYEYAAGIVLSLMGFWNSVIYIATSRAACAALVRRVFGKGRGKGEEVSEMAAKRMSEDRGTTATMQGRSVSGDTLTDSTEALAIRGSVV